MTLMIGCNNASPTNVRKTVSLILHTQKLYNSLRNTAVTQNFYLDTVLMWTSLMSPIHILSDTYKHFLCKTMGFGNNYFLTSIMLFGSSKISTKCFSFCEINEKLDNRWFLVPYYAHQFCSLDSDTVFL